MSCLINIYLFIKLWNKIVRKCNQQIKDGCKITTIQRQGSVIKTLYSF